MVTRSRYTAAFGVLALAGCAADASTGFDVGGSVQVGDEMPGADGELEGAAALEQPIIDGVPTSGAGPLAQWEGIVQLFTAAGSCSGAFITASHVLSAGHCFASEGPQSVWLQAPTWDGGRMHEFPDSSIAIRGKERGDDIAVVALNAAPPWATVARRFRLHSGTTRLGVQLSIYGYGAYDQANGNDGMLRRPPGGATIRITEQGNGFFKADAGEARICWGDSGGPALHERAFGVIWGVAHSFSYDRGTTERPCPTSAHEMTWTKVNENLDFIERQIGFACRRFEHGGQEYARCW